MSKKQSNIYHRKDGRWEARFHITGTKKYRSVYGRTYSEAKNKLMDLKNDCSLMTEKYSPTFSELSELWLEDKKLKVKESTFSVYQLKYNIHLYSQWERKEVSVFEECYV